jgi:hypothetical protein
MDFATQITRQVKFDHFNRAELPLLPHFFHALTEISTQRHLERLSQLRHKELPHEIFANVVNGEPLRRRFSESPLLVVRL